MKNIVKFIKKKLFFQNVLVFIDVFYRYYYIRFSFTQIACDIMCVQHVIQ